MSVGGSESKGESILYQSVRNVSENSTASPHNKLLSECIVMTLINHKHWLVPQAAAVNNSVKLNSSKHYADLR